MSGGLRELRDKSIDTSSEETTDHSDMICLPLNIPGASGAPVRVLLVSKNSID